MRIGAFYVARVTTNSNTSIRSMTAVYSIDLALIKADWKYKTTQWSELWQRYQACLYYVCLCLFYFYNILLPFNDEI